MSVPDSTGCTVSCDPAPVWAAQKSHKFAAPSLNRRYVYNPMYGYRNACRSASDGREDGTMDTATVILDERLLRWEVSDVDLEAAAEETALTYTYQTSVYYPCCQ